MQNNSKSTSQIQVIVKEQDDIDFDDELLPEV